MSDVKELTSGNQIVKSFTTAYDPTTFNSDYFRCRLNNTGEAEGNVAFTSDSFSRIYVDVSSSDWESSYIQKALMSVISNDGFDYHYYKTVVLYAGCSDPDEPILSGNGVLAGNNVVYIQDVTQQAWEYSDDEDETVTVKTSREGLEQESFGAAYVLSIKGSNADNTKAIMLCYEDSQACYWDTTDNCLKWKDIEAGKVYNVMFDTEHNTERWFVGAELAASEKESLLNRGLYMAADKYLAETLIDSSIGCKVYCYGNGDNNLALVFSINTGFTTPETHYLEFIGRPSAILLSTYTYEKDGEVVTEEEGEYTWSVNIEGENFSLIIPKNDLSTYVIEGQYTESYNYADLYRHTFTLSTPDLTNVPDNDYAVNCSFMAVNCQAGDTGIEYLLHSDENYQTVDWTLPVNGQIGVVSNHAVTTWYPAIKIYAGWTAADDTIRCLKIQYLNNGSLTTVEVITDSNKDNYNCVDFRSVIAGLVTY